MKKIQTELRRAPLCVCLAAMGWAACGGTQAQTFDASRADVPLSAFDAGSVDRGAALDGARSADVVTRDQGSAIDRSAPDRATGVDRVVVAADAQVAPDASVGRDAALPDLVANDVVTTRDAGPGDAGSGDRSDASPALDAGMSDFRDAALVTDAGGGDAGVVTGPSRYTGAGLRSPITPAVAAWLRRVRARDTGLADDVFMKVGDTDTVSSNFMACFAGAPYSVDLDGRSELQTSIDFFAGGDAAGTDPYTRVSLAADLGRTATWAVGGTPSPVEQEQSALGPRFSLVGLGTYDMNMGLAPRSATYSYYIAMWPLLNDMLLAGVIPVVTGPGPRADSADRARWAPTYSLIARGLAQHFQVPFIDLLHAAGGLPGQGLDGNGVFGNVYTPSTAEPCDFSAAGLAYGFNMRNLLTLQTLHALKQIVVDGAAASDAAPAALQGQGSAADPWIIDSLSFTHSADTRDVAASAIDAYPACDTGQDESGGEYFYRLDLTASTALRVLLLDLNGVDVDLHLLDGSPDASSCLERHDFIIERTLAAGTYYLAIDTYVPAGDAPWAGSYMLVVLACEAGDPDCT